MKLQKWEEVCFLYHSLQFYDSLARFGLADTMRRAGCVIAAYSGGADSTCLLHHLAHWCEENDVQLLAAHVNHGIRGEDADRDEQFCREICGKLQIPLYVRHENIPELARQTGRGLEETAREVRYAFFEELAGQHGGAVIATAHNADDHLETVLFHLLRGSGLRGLCGIDPLRDGRFLRPLIADTGADIRRWCADNGVPYVTDATNADTDYTRNFIRHRLIPPMEEIAEHPQKAVLRMTSLLRQDSDFLEQTAGQYVPDRTSFVDRAVLNSLHPAIASRVLIRLYGQILDIQKLYGNRNAGASLEEIHIREMLRLAACDVPETSYSLPGRLCFRTDRHTVRIEPEENRSVSSENSGGIVFTYPDDGDIFRNERYIIQFSPDGHANIPQEEENIYKLFICRTFCFDKIKNVLHIRYRRPGDTCRIGGMTRKVKKLFIDRKLTAEEKALLPLLCDGDGEILWIPHFPPRDGTTAGNGECGLTITVYEKKTF